MQLSIKGRLIALASLALVAVCALGLFAVGSNQVNARALNSLYERDIETLVRLQKLENILLEVRFRAAGVLLDQMPIPGSLNHLREAQTKSKELADELRQRLEVVSLEADTLETARQLERGFAVVVTTLARLEQGYEAKDRNLLTTILEEDWAALHQAAIKPLQALIPITQQRAADGYATASATSNRLLGGGMTLAVLCLAGLAGLALWTGRSLLRPLKEVEQAIRSISNGELDAPTPRPRSDELGRMIAALSEMQQRLRALVTEVHRSADSIATAGDEIATGNLDLSSRTEQTTVNLQQTTDSMAHITETVQRSVDSARQADELATSAASVASRGGEVVALVVQTMGDINTSSKKIADIIGVIDSIAFQTNILALNAAVEAARAGDQGRGFAVVASEVRSLAQRSAQAAKEIKALIGDSVDRVESGARLVGDAGSTMNEIVVSVQRVSNIIAEITAAAAAQSEGIVQVNGAVGQLDQMTQQNAALVEQSAAAAERLKAQTGRLAEVMAAFRTGAG